MAKKKKEYSEEIQRLLKTVVDHFDQEERTVRNRQILLWRKLKLYWNGYQRVWYDSVAHDWRTWDQALASDASTDQGYYDKPVNVFRAYLESIIAALSQSIPRVVCYPDNADDNLDLETAKTGDKIYDLVFRHNDCELLWPQALFILCTEGLVAAHNYTKADDAYGTYEVDKYEDVTEEHHSCPNCGAIVDDQYLRPTDVELEELEINEFQPEDDDVELQDNLLNNPGKVCPQCQVALDPELQATGIIVTKLVGTEEHPKSRQCIEIKGGLYVKVPNYAKTQADCPYLIDSYETHYANVIERYPHLRDKVIQGETGSGNSTGIDSYERWARMSTQYNGEFPTNVVTCQNSWLRPAAFNILSEEDAKKLKKEFPNGAKCVFVNGNFAEACNESLDDHWTLTFNPLSDYIHFDPLGQSLVSIQDITNDMLSLSLQTIEHGITQTFADPAVLNFKQYEQVESTPGMIFPATPKAGKSLGESFFELKTATLSQEVGPFTEKVNELGQFVSGAMPGIWGGSQPGDSSGTASEYAMSRQQALQRLQITWKILNHWWRNIWGKVIPQYIKDVTQDERDVLKTKDGGFMNVFIRRAELSGKIGRIELDSAEDIPVSNSQKRDMLMQFLQAGSPEVVEAFADPDSIPFLAKILGIPEIKLPGMADRQRQYEEIKLLQDSEPLMPSMPMPSPMVMEGEMLPPPPDMMEEKPSISIEPLVDNHQIHIDICRNWLKSEAGQMCKLENIRGYQNVLLHLKEHMAFIAETTPNPGAAGEESGSKPQNDKIAAPMKNERNNGPRPTGGSLEQ